MITSSKYTFNKIHRQNTHLLTAIHYVRNKIFNGKNLFFAISQWILCHVRLSFFRLRVVITVQLYSTQSTLRFCTCSNRAYRILEVCERFWIRTDFFYEVRWSEGQRYTRATSCDCLFPSLLLLRNKNLRSFSILMSPSGMLWCC